MYTKFKGIIYKTKDIKGSSKVGAASVDFLESRYKEKQKIKTFNFTKFKKTGRNDQNSDNDKEKFDLKNISFKSNPDNPNDMDPIQYNNSDVSYQFDAEDAITHVNSKKPKKKKPSTSEE